MVSDPEIQRRKSMSFAQAEGAEALPSALRPNEISPILRNSMWVVLFKHIEKHKNRSSMGGRPYITGVFNDALEEFFVFYQGKPVDEFNSYFEYWVAEMKDIILNKEYIEFYGTIQYLCKLLKKKYPIFCLHVSKVLETRNAGYRLHDNEVLVPVGSEIEARTIENALKSLNNTGRSGALSHLKAAIEAYNKNDPASAVRESIHSVESIIKFIDPTASTLSDGLKKMRKSGKTHPALREGFDKLYGYSSSEEGIRHALVDRESANVHPDEALFMIGACAAFVTYLLNQHEQAN